MLRYLWSLIKGKGKHTHDPQKSLKITPLQQRYPHIHLPKKYGPINQRMHAIDLKKQGVDEFNPELYPNTRLKHTWAKILAIGEPRAFSEHDYITALGYSLSGQPMETFQNLTQWGKTLPEIILSLIENHDPEPTKKELERQLHTFHRQPGEPIRKTVARFHELWEQKRHDFTPSVWLELRDKETEDLIIRSVSTQDKQQLEMHITQQYHTGKPHNWRTLTDWMEFIENIHNDNPDLNREYQDTSEPISIPIQTLHIHEPEGLTPTLVYIPLTISDMHNQNNPGHIEIVALHDSGCAQSVLRTDVLHEMIKQGISVRLVPTPPKFTVVTAAGVKHTPDGLARIQITFNRGTDNELSYPITVIVYKHLSQQFLLGRDFTGSQYKICETNDYMYLGASQRHGIQGIPTEEQIQDNQACRVTLITTSGYAPKYVRSNKPLTIPPQSYQVAHCSLEHMDNKNDTASTHTYEVSGSTLAKAATYPTIHKSTLNTNIPILLFNTSNEPLHIPTGQRVAQIRQVQEDEVEITSTQEFPTQGTRDNTGNQERTIPDFITQDTGLTQEEQAEHWEEFQKNGYHYPSMTRTVENHAALTEMSLQKEDPLTLIEFLEAFELSHLPRAARRRAIQIFQKHQKAFSRHPFDLGEAKGILAKIPINSSDPHIQRYVPVPKALRTEIREKIDQYEEGGILRECFEPSPFCSNILAVRKKDGSVRFLLDGRTLNEYTTRLPTNLVTPLEVMAQLSGKKWVTTIDLSDAFYQIALHPDSQPYTAFYSEAHGKRYCFTRCPQGLKNSPLYLKLLMDQLFGDMHNTVIHYADDIMIATDGTIDHHLDKLANVLERLEKGNIKIRPKKVNIARDTIDFLGITWKKGQLNIPEAKVRAFKDIPIPNTPKKLKSVLCALSYYRRFVPKFANLTQELMAQTTLHPKQFNLTEAHKAQFTELIDTVCTNTSLHLPDHTKRFYVQTDASQFCGAGKVFQKDDEGNEHLLACIFRTFTKTEQHYSTIKKEVLALLYTLKSMDFFLRFADKITILVDAKAILYLRMCKDSAGILLRFSLELSNYNAEIIHVAGVENEVADVLSRHHKDIDGILSDKDNHPTLSEKETIAWLEKLSIPKEYTFTPEQVADMLDTNSLPSPDSRKKKHNSKARTGIVDIRNTPPTLHNRKVKLPPEVRTAPGAKLPRKKPESVQCNNLSFSFHDIQTMTRVFTAGTLTPQQFQEAQEQDPTCQDIEANPRSNPRFQCKQGVWFYENDDETLVPVLPAALLDSVINTAHHTVYGLHYSSTRIQRDIRKKYYVTPRILASRVKRITSDCFICKMNQTGLKDQTLEEIPIIPAPRTTWSVDIIPNMPETPAGHCKAILAVDVFTGFIQVCPLKDKTSKSLLNAIDQTIIRPFGIPKMIRSDNETGLWNSTEFFKYLEPLGIKFIPTSVASPWSNGHAERSIRTIKEGLRKFMQQEQIFSRWDEYISIFVQAHNQSASVYGHSPETLMFGYQKPIHTDLLEIWPNASDPQEYMDIIVERAEQQRQQITERRTNIGSSNRTYRNQTRVRKEFQIGDIVACRQLQVSTGPNSSLKPRHTGPYAVLQVNKDTLSCIVEDLTNGSESKQHFTNLIHVPFNPETQRVHGNFTDELHSMALDIANDRIQIRPQLRPILRMPLILSQNTTTPTQGASQTQDQDETTLSQQDRTLHH